MPILQVKTAFPHSAHALRRRLLLFPLFFSYSFFRLPLHALLRAYSFRRKTLQTEQPLTKPFAVPKKQKHSFYFHLTQKSFCRISCKSFNKAKAIPARKNLQIVQSKPSYIRIPHKKVFAEGSGEALFSKSAAPFVLSARFYITEKRSR